MRQVNTSSYESHIQNCFSEFTSNPCQETGRAVTQSVYDFIIAVSENLVEAYQVLNEIYESARRGQNQTGMEVLDAIYAAIYRRLPTHYGPIFEPQGIFA